MTDKLVQNFNIVSNPLVALSDAEIEGLLHIASTIEHDSPVNIDVKEGTISVTTPPTDTTLI